MPFLPNNPFLDEDKKKQEASAGTNISGDTGTFSSAGANQNVSSPSAPKASTKSGSFANLNQYLDANKDQAASMGTTVAGKVDESASKAQGSIDAFKNNAPSAISQLNESTLKSDYYDKASSLDDAAKANYNKLKTTGGYDGPSDFSQVQGYQDASKSYADATQKLTQAGTESGRQELLKSTYARPNYTQGENLLDQSLIQNNAESRQAFQDVNNRWSALNGLLDSTVSDKDAVIQWTAGARPESVSLSI